MSDSGYYSLEELKNLGFISIGKDVYISKKASIYGASKMSIGDNVRIDDFTVLSGKISIGSHIHIGSHGSMLGGGEGVTIEDFANISQGVRVYCASDDYSGATMTSPMIPDKYKKVEYSPVFIKRHAIVGSGVVILPGVTIAEGSAIGAMSMVKFTTEPWTIHAGIPAKVIRKRKNDLLNLERKFLADSKYV